MTFAGGLATVTATLDKAGWQKITATDTSVGNTVASGTSNGVSVTAAALDQFEISAVPESLTAGNSATVTFTAEDNLATSRPATPAR